MKRGEHGWVLAMPVPAALDAGRTVTVWWCGPDEPNLWTPDQKQAARFADAALLRHVRTESATGPHRVRPFDGDPTATVEPALSERNGGPTAPIITRATGTSVADPVIEAEQGGLF